jgi:hypothetical protein
MDCCLSLSLSAAAAIFAATSPLPPFPAIFFLASANSAPHLKGKKTPSISKKPAELENPRQNIARWWGLALTIWEM